MKVSAESTQPPAKELISYDRFLDKLEALKVSPRVRIDRVGQSNGGLGVYCIIIASEDAIGLLQHHKEEASRILTPETKVVSLSDVRVEPPKDQQGQVRYPVLITGLSFGHEAAHVEAQLQLVERLAWSTDNDTRAILGKLIVLVMPMLNPDGRTLALEVWEHHPRAADGSAGNLPGFLLNRDFLHLTQPETAAVLRVFREWHPLGLLDTHEDVFILGVQVPEVCWCPATGSVTVEEAPDNIKGAVVSLGKAIASAWSQRGYESYPRDLFAWTKPKDSGEEGSRYIFDGNLVQVMSIHGIPAAMTESARTLGTQTWEDRLQQKVSAGVAFLKKFASDAEHIRDTIYLNRQKAVQEARQPPAAFVIPQLQRERSAVAQIVNTLLQHDVKVYETQKPYPAYIVPLAQGEGSVARSLLSARSSKVLAMPPALGVAVSSYEVLPTSQKEVLANAKLRSVSESPAPLVFVPRRRPSSRPYAIPNTTDGVRLISRLLSAGYNAGWSLNPMEADDQRLESGSFVVEGISLDAIRMAAEGLHVSVLGTSTTVSRVRRLRRPKVALYTGQGTDGHQAPARADIWWGLKQLGFPCAALRAEDVTSAFLQRYDLLIVPAGDAQEILSGWKTNALLNTSPWELPGEPKGIGKHGLEAISAFVSGGGAYVGIDGGGGLLALRDYADLIDLEIIAHSLGSSRVLLRVREPAHPLMFGLTGYYSEDGTWVEGFVPALYHSDRFEGTVSGLIFGVGAKAITLASYYHVDHEPAHRRIIQEAFLSDEKAGTAIAFGKVGQGYAAVLGIRPGFRGVWSNTWKLISNAVFLSAVEEQE